MRTQIYLFTVTSYVTVHDSPCGKYLFDAGNVKNYVIIEQVKD